MEGYGTIFGMRKEILIPQTRSQRLAACASRRGEIYQKPIDQSSGYPATLIDLSEGDSDVNSP